MCVNSVYVDVSITIQNVTYLLIQYHAIKTITRVAIPVTNSVSYYCYKLRISYLEADSLFWHIGYTFLVTSTTVGYRSIVCAWPCAWASIVREW